MKLTTLTHEGESWTLRTSFGYDKRHDAATVGAMLEGLSVYRRNVMQDEIPHEVLVTLHNFDMDRTTFDSLAIVALESSGLSFQQLVSLGEAQHELCHLSTHESSTIDINRETHHTNSSLVGGSY